MRAFTNLITLIVLAFVAAVYIEGFAMQENFYVVGGVIAGLTIFAFIASS